jgi:hypothetical protein
VAAPVGCDDRQIRWALKRETSKKAERKLTKAGSKPMIHPTGPAVDDDVVTRSLIEFEARVFSNPAEDGKVSLSAG